MPKSVPIRVTASGIVSRAPCVVTGLFYLSTAAPKYVKLYDGLDDNGRLALTLQNVAGVSIGSLGGAQIAFPRGLYAVFETTGGELTVFVETKTEDEIEA
jgi:hypothetical protein